MNEKIIEKDNPEKTNIDKAIEAAKNNDYVNAINILKLEPESNKSSYVYSLIASYYIKLNDNDNALNNLNEALKKVPVYNGAYFLLGNLEMINGNYSRAINYYFITLLNQIDYPCVNLNIGVAYSKLNLYYQSLKAYERYIKYDENYDLNEYKEVKETLNRNIEISKKYIMKGKEAFSLNDFEKCVKLYAKAVKHYPSKSVLLNLANLFFADKNYEKALDYYENAYILSGSNKSFIYKMALCYDKLEKYDYAYSYYDLFINSNESKLDYSNIIQRMLYIKTKAFDDESVNRHLTIAQEYENNANYELALSEYTNYYVLTHRINSNILQKIKDLKQFVNPDKYYIKNAFKAIDCFFEKRKFDEAEKICNKICKVSKRVSSDYLNAQKYKYKIILARGGH